jgi:hypothetical protein
MELEKIEDHKFDDLVVELEKEIENLEKQKVAAQLKLDSIEAKEIAEPKDDEKILNLKAELELLSSLVVEREEKIKALNDEVKRRDDIKLKIQELIDSVDFEEEETHKKWDRETEAEVEYKVKLVHKFFHHLGFCDHIKYKEEMENLEGKIIEVEKEKEVFWDKKLILKHLKENLDVDKAQSLVDQIAGYKHNKKKGELEAKLKQLVQNNVYFLEAFGEEFKIIKGEKHGLSHGERIAKWDKDDLILFEEKIVKLEEAKSKLDDIAKKEKPIKERRLKYKEIDNLLFEALVEKLEEGRPEKMDKYLELRKDIKNKHPLEE